MKINIILPYFVFHLKGRQFDKNGNLVEWWSPETKKRFEDKAQCFIEQSNNFSPKGIDMKVSTAKKLHCHYISEVVNSNSSHNRENYVKSIATVYSTIW